MNVTYPRIDHTRGVAVIVHRHPGGKVCARIGVTSLAGIPIEQIPLAPVTPLRGFLLESHRSACLNVCLTVIRDHWPRATQPIIHRAMVTARRIIEGGGTIRSGVYHALNQLDPQPAA